MVWPGEGRRAGRQGDAVSAGAQSPCSSTVSETAKQRHLPLLSAQGKNAWVILAVFFAGLKEMNMSV